MEKVLDGKGYVLVFKNKSNGPYLSIFGMGNSDERDLDISELTKKVHSVEASGVEINLRTYREFANELKRQNSTEPLPNELIEKYSLKRCNREN